jgi:hypothetical protein
VRDLLTIARRAPLLTAAILIALVKSIEFAIDSQALFDYDSGAFFVNAMRLGFLPHRSYVYAFLIRSFAIPFHWLNAIVAMQMIMAGITAWLLTFALLRFFNVRPWIAIVTGLAFAMDPVQVVYDHMVMTENATLLAIALFLVAALQYLRDPRPVWLAIFSFLGIAVVSLRIAYLPVVLAGAVLLPAGAYLSSPARRPRVLALALVVSCGFTALFHVGYRHLTGRLGGREPAYHYMTGFFLVAGVAPMIEPEDGGDPRLAGSIVAQDRSRFPLTPRAFRESQLWNPDGFVARLTTIFGGDASAADRAAQRIALAAIRRNPLGFIKLGLLNYRGYWGGIRRLRENQLGDDFGPDPIVVPYDARLISCVFGVDVSNQHTWWTPSRRYHRLGKYWYAFLLGSPFLAGFAMWLSRANRPGVAVLLLWPCLSLTAMCFGADGSPYRYLHSFSFTGLAAAAVLCETLAGRSKIART